MVKAWKEAKLIDRIIIYYETYQPIYDQLGAELHQGLAELPTDEQIRDSVLIIDDLATATKNSKTMLFIEKLFSIKTHHLPCTVFFIVQNLHPGDARYKTLIRNANYFIVTKSRGSNISLQMLQKELFPYKRGVLVSAMEQSKHRYLLIDNLTQKEDFCLKSGILPDDQAFVYAIQSDGYDQRAI